MLPITPPRNGCLGRLECPSTPEVYDRVRPTGMRTYVRCRGFHVIARTMPGKQLTGVCCGGMCSRVSASRTQARTFRRFGSGPRDGESLLSICPTDQIRRAHGIATPSKRHGKPSRPHAHGRKRCGASRTARQEQTPGCSRSGQQSGAFRPRISTHMRRVGRRQAPCRSNRFWSRAPPVRERI